MFRERTDAQQRGRYDREVRRAPNDERKKALPSTDWPGHRAETLFLFSAPPSLFNRFERWRVRYTIRYDELVIIIQRDNFLIIRPYLPSIPDDELPKNNGMPWN
jgi:hypothetical protein